MKSAALKILVLGSKPNAKVIPYDVAYCANAACFYYKKELLKFQCENGYVVGVISASEVSNSDRASIDKQRWLRSKREQILSADLETLIVYGCEGRDQAIDDIRNTSSARKKVFLSDENYRKLLRNISGFRIPIFDTGLLRFNLRYSCRVVYIFVKDILGITKEVHGLFRPSTGVIALLIAINEHGKSAKYCIAGIGVSGRELYKDSLNTWTSNIGLVTRHVYADIKIIKKLRTMYSIEIQDSELDEATR